MADTEIERALIGHAKQLTERKDGVAVKKYGGIVVTTEEVIRSSGLRGEYLDAFIKETGQIHKHQDTLSLVCLGLLCEISFSEDKTSMMPQTNETNVGFILSQYYPVKRLILSERAAELFPEERTPVVVHDNGKDFENLISLTIGKLYKKSPLWKQKLMWQLVKEWNSPRFSSGIARLVRDRLGEEAALTSFRETANKIMSDSELLNKAINDYHEVNPYAN